MLIEMHSPVFMEKGLVRPPIRFGPGLNVVLGKENGENSIGKSSALLAIDFAFGGNTYLRSDGVHHLGDHTVFFTFQFKGRKYYFARSTEKAEEIHVCTQVFQLTGEKWARSEFAAWLAKMYDIDFPGLTFRSAVSGFFRIYRKGNTDERKPLCSFYGQTMVQSIDTLVKLFDRYRDVETYNSKLEEKKSELEAFRAARKYRFVPDLVGGQAQYDQNILDIMGLESDLENLINNQDYESDERDIQKARMKTQLTSEKMKLEARLQALERRLNLVSMSTEFGLYPTEADLGALQEFFPTVNVRKIYEVENYHHKLATILDKQFSEERRDLEEETRQTTAQLKAIESQIQELGLVGNLTTEFLDKHAEIKGKIEALKTQNAAYLKLVDLQEAKKRADDQLKKAIKSILSEIEEDINYKMKEYNDTLYMEARKGPHLSLYDYNSYKFETPDDTGTGSNYKSLVIYDLSILALTALPAIAHDSLILKNISDDSIDGIMKIYSESQKQVFIAFDKQIAYKPRTQEILQSHTVLKLSDDGHELYGVSWNKENEQ